MKVASTSSSMLLGKPLTLAQLLRLRSSMPRSELGEVGHEDVGEVDHGRAASHRVDGDDRQGHQDRVGVVLLDRLVQRRARGRLVVDVAADELDAVADAAEDEHHLVVADRACPVMADAPGDRDRHEQRLVELVGPDLGVEVVALLVEGEQPLDLLGPAGHLVEVAELAGRGPAHAPAPGPGDHPLEVDGALGPRLLRRQVRDDEKDGQSRGPSHNTLAIHEALLWCQWPGTGSSRHGELVRSVG